MAHKKDEEKPKKKKHSDDGLFFLGIIGVAVLIFAFYVSPNKQANIQKNQNKTNAVATTSVTKNNFFDLFRLRPIITPATSTNTQNKYVYQPINYGTVIPNTTQIDTNTYSKWKGKISLQTGNAMYEESPYKEYVTIYASDVPDEGVRITGWTLQNGRGNKYFNRGGNNVIYPSESATIPDGAKIFLPRRINYFQPVVLKKNQSAVVVTGGALNVGSKISGFQVNKCIGYVERDPQYQFYPPLSSQCPIPREEEGVRMMEKSCYDFIQSLQACHEPKFPEVVFINGVAERGYVDNTPGLSTQCKDFLKSHFNYNSCVAIHSDDTNFYANEWRLFLNRPFEMWGNDRELFTLYDNEGKIVDQISTTY